MKGLFSHIKPDALKKKDEKAAAEPENTPVAATDLEATESEMPDTENTETVDQQTNDNPQASDEVAEVTAHDGPRFSVGIDLGTTHCVLSYADLSKIDDEFSQQVMAIPQLTSPGAVEEKEQLPSFLYQAHEAELAEGSTSLPWAAKPDYLVGEIARNLGSKTPIRLVASAKSWLCHAGVDCKSPILPAEAPDEVERVSPFQATTAYLAHLREAWESLHPDAPLDEQDLVITVPASFDPAARELTVEAARSVGLDQAILLEEPQAALYSWIEKSHGDWRNYATCGDIILVIDIGGGTTDLSLIAVTEQGGNLELTRVAVGDHILLGGDNMDLALAYTVKAKLEQDGKRLESWQIQALTHSCRDAKEKIFNNAEIDTIPLVVASRGSSLIGGTLRTELKREEVNRVLVEGFMPKVAASRPADYPHTYRFKNRGPALCAGCGHYAASGGVPGQTARRGGRSERRQSARACQLPASDCRAVQWRRAESAGAGRPVDGSPEFLAGCRKGARSQTVAGRRSGSGCCARRRLLRLRAQRQRRAHQRRYGRVLLCRRRKRHAGRAGHGTRD